MSVTCSGSADTLNEEHRLPSFSWAQCCPPQYTQTISVAWCWLLSPRHASRALSAPPPPPIVRPGVLFSLQLVLGPKGGLTFGGVLTFRSFHFAATLLMLSSRSGRLLMHVPARKQLMFLERCLSLFALFQSKAKTYHLMVSISVHTLWMIVDCVSGRRPKCVAALHVPFGGSYFWDGWSGSFRGVFLLGLGLTFGRWFWMSEDRCATIDGTGAPGWGMGCQRTLLMDSPPSLREQCPCESNSWRCFCLTLGLQCCSRKGGGRAGSGYCSSCWVVHCFLWAGRCCAFCCPVRQMMVCSATFMVSEGGRQMGGGDRGHGCILRQKIVRLARGCRFFPVGGSWGASTGGVAGLQGC